MENEKLEDLVVNSSSDNEISKKKFENKPNIIMLIAIVLVVGFLIGLAIRTKSVYDKPQNVAVANSLAAYNEDYNTWMDTIAPFALKQIAVLRGMPEDTTVEEIRKTISDMIEALEREKAFLNTDEEEQRPEMKIKVTDVKFFDFDENTPLGDYVGTISEEDMKTIKKGAYVTAQVRIGDDVNRTEKMTCVKIGMNWYYLCKEQ